MQLHFCYPLAILQTAIGTQPLCPFENVFDLLLTHRLVVVGDSQEIRFDSFENLLQRKDCLHDFRKHIFLNVGQQVDGGWEILLNEIEHFNFQEFSDVDSCQRVVSRIENE